MLVLYFSILLEYQHQPSASLQCVRRGESPAGEITEPAADWTTDGDHLSLSAAAGNWITLTICLCCTCIPLLFTYLCHVCVCLWRLFSITSLNVWNPPDLLYGCTRPDLTMSHLQDITSFMVCHMTMRGCAHKLRKVWGMRWCLKAPDLLSLVIRLKVIFFGHFGPQFRWWSNFLLTLSILKLDPQDQTPLLLHSIDSIKPTPGAKNSMDFLAVR